MREHVTGVNRLTLREQVTASLRKAITSGQIPLGAPLIETELASAYEVSRGTVREALRELQTARLVSGDSRGKLHVRRPSATEIAELFMVRAALEGMAAEIITTSANCQELAEDLRGHLPAETVEGDFAQSMTRDLAFHERLIALCGNRTLAEVWARLQDRMRMVFFASEVDRDTAIMTRASHEPIVEAIAAGDPPQARETITAHMRAAIAWWAEEPPAS